MLEREPISYAEQRRKPPAWTGEQRRAWRRKYAKTKVPVKVGSGLVAFPFHDDHVQKDNRGRAIRTLLSRLQEGEANENGIPYITTKETYLDVVAEVVPPERLDVGLHSGVSGASSCASISL
jgi:hypothetical protein